MRKRFIFFLFLIVAMVVGFFLYFYLVNLNKNVSDNTADEENKPELQANTSQSLNALTIESLRNSQYPGSDIMIEQTLDPGSNYNRYIASYKSEGLKIFALFTVPSGEKPKNGWPVIIFNHGFIPPTEYKTTERYIIYTDAFSRNGYIVFKSDYRGHGSSEGIAPGGYGSNAYTIDVLNALSSIKKYKDANPNRIGMWGHSMGGFITLRSMVVTKDIKVGVIWGGVVASYPDLITSWRRKTFTPPSQISPKAQRWRSQLIDQYATPEKNPSFWNSISANSYLKDISGPLQLHHGEADESVPLEFSKNLYQQMKSIGREVELYTYPGNDHNISASLNLALSRSVTFFDKYLK